VAGVKPREATAEGGSGLTQAGPTASTISDRMGGQRRFTNASSPAGLPPRLTFFLDYW